jgi:hypothetical protein
MIHSLHTGVIDLQADIRNRVCDEISWHRNSVVLVKRRLPDGTARQSIEIGTHSEVAAEPYLSIALLEVDVLLHTNRGVFNLHSGGRR